MPREEEAEKSEAEIHQTGTPEPNSVKKCQSYFQQPDNCGDIWSARVEEKDPSFQETGDPTAHAGTFPTPQTPMDYVWELAEGKDPRKKVSTESTFKVWEEMSYMFHGTST